MGRSAYDDTRGADRVWISGPTVYAVVNTGAAGVGNSIVTINPRTDYIGLMSVSGNVNLGAGINGVGFATVNVGGLVNIGNAMVTVTLGTGLNATSDSVLTENDGTAKTLIIKPIAISASGNTTVFVPTGTFKVTHLLLNSDATVRTTILSGASYLVGNASVGVTLSPNGGWVENGSPDSPIYIGLAADAGLVVNTSATANVGGKVVYYQE